MSVPGHLGARVLTLKWGQTRLSAGGPTVSGDLGLLQGLPLPPPPSTYSAIEFTTRFSLRGIQLIFKAIFQSAIYQNFHGIRICKDPTHIHRPARAQP